MGGCDRGLNTGAGPSLEWVAVFVEGSRHEMELEWTIPHVQRQRGRKMNECMEAARRVPNRRDNIMH